MFLYDFTFVLVPRQSKAVPERYPEALEAIMYDCLTVEVGLGERACV